MKKTKSVLILLLSLVMLFSFAACSSEEPAKPTEKATEPATEPSYENWVDKTKLTPTDRQIFTDIVIQSIHPDFFIARTVIAQPYQIKLNGKISDEWCVGDQVICTYNNVYYDRDTDRIEADMLTIEKSYFVPDPEPAYKPVVYLYPTEETEVEVKLELDGELLCTYPAYRDSWKVTASPDGTLTDGKLTYNYLFWEGKLNTKYDFSEGFCIKGSDTAAFLETALAQLGLNRREANEFIVFWLEKMQNQPYNVISFQTEAYTDHAELEITPQPDTMIRVFMAWRPSDEFVELPEQKLSAPERSGFTVVEWGGVLSFS